MKLKKLFLTLLILALAMLVLVSCGKKKTGPEPILDEDAVYSYTEIVEPDKIPIPSGTCGEAYLYGEEHANGSYVKKELELWQHYYQEEGLRHLFVELPYYAAQSLNLWMQADDDAILDQFFEDFAQTNAGTPVMRSFYEVIKETCPGTVFHGTDVGRSDDAAGKHYLDYLKEAGLENSEEYKLAQNSMEQGNYFMRDYFFNDEIYREEMMAYNFASTLTALNGQNVMGIYGAAHISDKRNDDPEQNRMFVRLQDEYNLSVTAEDLYSKDAPALAPTSVSLAGKSYKTKFLGENVFMDNGTVQVRSFLRILGAHVDLTDPQTNGKTMLSSDYPEEVQSGEIYAILTTTADGGVTYEYYQATERAQNDALVLNGIAVE